MMLEEHFETMDDFEILFEIPTKKHLETRSGDLIHRLFPS